MSNKFSSFLPFQNVTIHRYVALAQAHQLCNNLNKSQEMCQLIMKLRYKSLSNCY